MPVIRRDARGMTIAHGGRPTGLPRQRTAGQQVTTGQRVTMTTAAPAPPVQLGWQVAVLAAAAAAYFLVRGATEAAYGEALRHAHALVDLERALGIYVEPALQDALAGSPRVRAVLNAVYIYGHWPVIVASLIWLARRHPAIYLRARDTMLISGGVGLVVFVSFPVAPPRLAGLGMTDTVSVAADAYRLLQPHMFTNQYAAMPSLHVGWDLVIGLALAAAVRRPLLRALALAMPVAMVVAVVLTANHYLVDAVAGAALTATCWFAVGRYARRRSRPAPTAEPVAAPLPEPLPAPIPVPIATRALAATPVPGRPMLDPFRAGR
jgi:hypothetical protein